MLLFSKNFYLKIILSWKLMNYTFQLALYPANISGTGIRPETGYKKAGFSCAFLEIISASLVQSMWPGWIFVDS
jgi:hypothetical protein